LSAVTPAPDIPNARAEVDRRKWAAANDDFAVFRAMCATGIPQVYSWMFQRCGDAALAEDLTSETLSRRQPVTATVRVTRSPCRGCGRSLETSSSIIGAERSANSIGRV
jgi:hypothetical protein